MSPPPTARRGTTRVGTVAFKRRFLCHVFKMAAREQKDSWAVDRGQTAIETWASSRSDRGLQSHYSPVGMDKICQFCTQAASLGHYGIVRVLFETPSGFAIFSLDGLLLLPPDAIEHIWANFGGRYRATCVWIRDFQFFVDKSGAINHDTGVSDKLSKMLQLLCLPGQKLAVGKPEYKMIIEDCLGIPCLYDEAVMEVMWGIKNLMHSLVPEEKSKLPKGDRLQMSLGLKILLNRYGFDVEPEMVSDPIIAVACALYDCDECDKKLSGPLHKAGDIIKDVSHINCDDWDLLKLATAGKMICFPEEKIVVGNPQEMFSTDELSKLVNDAPRYKDKLLKYDCLMAYNLVVTSHKVRNSKRKLMSFLIKEAEKACEAGQGDDLRKWGLDDQERPFKSLRSQN